MVTPVFGETVTLRRKEPTGAYDPHDGTVIWASVDIPIPDSVVTPEPSEEQETGSMNTASERWVWYPPLDTEVGVTDTVIFRGREFDVHGPPLVQGFNTFTGNQARPIVRLVRKT